MRNGGAYQNASAKHIFCALSIAGSVLLTLERGKSFRFGRHNTLEGSDLIVWSKTESDRPMAIELARSAD